MRSNKNASVKTYLNKKQKAMMRRLRLQTSCSYSELLRSALYEKYPQLKNIE